MSNRWWSLNTAKRLLVLLHLYKVLAFASALLILPSWRDQKTEEWCTQNGERLASSVAIPALQQRASARLHWSGSLTPKIKVLFTFTAQHRWRIALRSSRRSIRIPVQDVPAALTSRWPLHWCNKSGWLQRDHHRITALYTYWETSGEFQLHSALGTAWIAMDITKPGWPNASPARHSRKNMHTEIALRDTLI